MELRTINCVQCEGTGNYYGRCDQCGGSGQVPDYKTGYYELEKIASEYDRLVTGEYKLFQHHREEIMKHLKEKYPEEFV